MTLTVTAACFDLDGTLTDPAEGITRCLSHALTTLGAPCPPYAELAACIGPPLRGTFARLLPDPEQVEDAVAHYRERFSTIGLYENAVYPGIPEMLDDIAAAGLRLFIVTSKPCVYAIRILEHFALAERFAGIYGAELDGRFENKAELLAHVLATEGLTHSTAVMIGDRRHDIEAAQANGTGSIGVTYGYGSAEELTTASADHLCATPAEVAATLRTLTPAAIRPPV